MGADFRLKNEADYKQWYGKDYADPALHEAAVYCIPELHRARLAGAKLIGNPGCYPTSIALGLAPAVKAGAIDPATLVIDSKSGATGAGRGLALNTHYTECNEAFAPYKVGRRPVASSTTMPAARPRFMASSGVRSPLATPRTPSVPKILPIRSFSYRM